MRRSIILSTLLSLAVADTPLSFFWPGGDDVNGTNPDASIVSANKATTVVALNCPQSVDSDDCGWGSGQITFSIISTSIFQASVQSADLDFTCTSNSANVACSLDVAYDSSTINVMTTLTGSDAAMQTATVTAGEDKLKAASTVASSATSGSMTTSASAGAKASAASATGSAASAKASAASATGSAASASATHTAAATRFGVEGAALAAMVGAAALVL